MVRMALRAGGFAISSDDVLALRWMSGFGYATAPQIAYILDRPEKQITQRMTKLQDTNLLRRHAWTRGFPDVLVPTRAGLMTAGYVTADDAGRARPDLRVPRFTLSMAAHTLGVCDLAVGYWRRGFDVVSEREINRVDARDRGKDNFLDPLRWAVFHTPGRTMPYVPDFVVAAPGTNPYRDRERPPNLDPAAAFVTRAGQRYGTADGGVLTVAEQYPTLGDGSRPVAIELERTKKRRGEYEEIMAGYKAANHLAGVVYYASTRPIASALAAAAKAVGLGSDRLVVNLHLPWLAMPDL